MRTGYFYLLGFCFVACFMLPGCSLFGPSVEKAQEIADKRQAEMDTAILDLKNAEAELRDLLARYDQAVKDDDKTAIEALTFAIQAALSKKDAAERVADSAGKVFESAVQDFKDAKSASDYIGTIFGWAATILGGLGIGGTATVAIRNGLRAKRNEEALEGTTNLVDKLRPESNEDPKWLAATNAMNTNLSPGAKKAIEEARP